MCDKHFTQVVTSPHYEFVLHAYFRCYREKYTTVHLYVGDDPSVSTLSISFLYENFDNYNPSPESTIGNINHIKKFRSALHKPVSDEIWKKYSFPSEMLLRVMDIIRTNFPYVKHLQLSDDSQLECSYNPMDKLDLLYYNVAIHKKTWYEKEFNAYFLPRDEFIQYRCSIENYASPKTKDSISWESIEHKIISKGTPLIYNYVKDNTEKCRNLYETSKTLPIFLKSLGDLFPYEQKCYVYKEWIKHFIKDFTHGEISREWIIDVYQVPSKTLIVKRGGGTRKRKRGHE